MKKITSLFLVAILYGCGSSVSPVDQGLIDQVMHIGNGSEPQGSADSSLRHTLSLTDVCERVYGSHQYSHPKKRS